MRYLYNEYTPEQVQYEIDKLGKDIKEDEALLKDYKNLLEIVKRVDNSNRGTKLASQNFSDFATPYNDVRNIIKIIEKDIQNLKDEMKEVKKLIR